MGEKLGNNRKEQEFRTRAYTIEKIEALVDKLDLDNQMDVISKDSFIEGNFCFGLYTRIEGKVKGTIESNGLLVLGSGSEIWANIKGNNLVIDGIVHGNISATTLIIVQEHGVINGNIEAPSIEFEHGAVLNGSVSMKKFHPEASL